MPHAGHCTIELEELSLDLRLGWSRGERNTPQRVLFDIRVDLALPPRASESDSLEDTICYARIAERLREGLGSREFHLLEYLAAEAARLVRDVIRSEHHALGVELRVAKSHPPVEGLRRAAFTYRERLTREAGTG